MAIPLILEDGQLDDLRKHAEEHPISLAEIREIVDGKAAVVGDRPGHWKEITTRTTEGGEVSFGWSVVYSIEEHPLKDGSGTIWLRHMTMAQAVPGRYPNRFALELVSQQLGFPPFEECMVGEDPGTNAISVMASYR